MALSGRTRTEELGDAQVDAELANLGVPKKDTQRMLELVERHGLGAVPQDARSLQIWIARVRAALAPDPSE